jgi:DNA-directed RNA polymerase III subunit RPC2
MGFDDWCQYCKQRENMAVLRLPYACKLLFQELISMNILPRITLGEPDEAREPRR